MYVSKAYVHLTDRDSLLTNIYNYIEAAGWQLVDNQDSNGYRVYSSDGENGDRIPEFVKISGYSSDKVKFNGFYKWDTTNHTGSGGNSDNTNNSFYLHTSSDYFAFFYGNKDMFIVLTKVGSTFYIQGAGHLKRFYDKPLAKITAAATAGDNVTLAVDNVDEFEEGKYYHLVGASQEGRWWVQVSHINDSSHITLANLPADISANSLIGAEPSTFTVFEHGYDSTVFSAVCTQAVIGNLISFSPTKVNGLNDLSSNYSYSYASFFPLGFPTMKNKSGVFDEYFLSPMFAGFWTYNYSNGKHFKGNFGFFDEEYFLATAIGGNEEVFYIGELENGTSSGNNDATHLNDTSKNWTTDQFKDKVLVITNGPAQGEVHKITGNSATQLTLADNFLVIPDNTSNYVIVEKAYRKIAKVVGYNANFLMREGV